MSIASRDFFFVLLGAALSTLGCAAETLPEDGEELMQEGTGAEEGEEVMSDAQPLIFTGQTAIQATNGECWKAYNSNTIVLATCNYYTSSNTRQAWIFEDTTLLIRSAHYGTRCAAMPASATGRVYLKECDPSDSYQWFSVVPHEDGYGLICGWALDPYGNERCASHEGTSPVYHDPPTIAPSWYRIDY